MGAVHGGRWWYSKPKKSLEKPYYEKTIRWQMAAQDGGLWWV